MTKLSILHAIYGVGALCSPLVATQFSQLPHWSYHYLASLGVALIVGACERRALCASANS